MHEHSRPGAVVRAGSGVSALLALCVGASGCYEGLPSGDGGMVGETESGVAVSAGVERVEAEGDGGGPGDESDEGEGSEEGEGSDGGDDGDDAGDDTGDVAACAGVPQRPLHRLTPAQYRNTIQDLFGLEAVEVAYEDEAPVVTELGVRQLRATAEDLLEHRTDWTAEVFPCDVEGELVEGCAEAFLRGFGSRAFRRPLTEYETGQLLGVYDAALGAELPFGDAMGVLLATVLQSPSFVYLIEQGSVDEEDAQAQTRPLTGYEVANRLSYLLWDTMPDETLFAAAEAGLLATAEGIAEQTERMLVSPRAEAKLQRFFSDWLQLDGGKLHFSLEETRKDEMLFPEFQPAMREAMRLELEAFVHEVMQDSSGASFERLFTDRSAYVNATLADLYGVEGPADDDTWMWVDLDDTQRAGILTRAAFLSVFATAVSQSPIRRGVFVIEELMCAHLADPPPNVNDTPIESGEGEDEEGQTVLRSIRDEVTARTDDAECAGCHGLINPVGFLFEHYDAIGRWQTEEAVSGQSVDASGALTIGPDAGPLADAVALSEALADSEMARRCFAGRWITQAFDVSLEEDGGCDQQAAVDAFVESGNIAQLLTHIVTTDAFRHLNVSEVESK